MLPKFSRLHQISGTKELIFYFCNLKTKDIIIYLSSPHNFSSIAMNCLTTFLLFLETTTAVSETAGIETISFLQVQHQIINLIC